MVDGHEVQEYGDFNMRRMQLLCSQKVNKTLFWQKSKQINCDVFYCFTRVLCISGLSRQDEQGKHFAKA